MMSSSKASMYCEETNTTEYEENRSTLSAEVSVSLTEKEEEEKLKKKYSTMPNQGLANTLLQKHRSHRMKYFDSGDYNMAQAASKSQRSSLLKMTIGEGIPTPEGLATRKPSIVQSKLASDTLP